MKKFNNIGALRERIEIHAPQETEDGSGGVLRSHTLQQTVWGRIYEMRKKSRIKDDVFAQEYTHKIIVRNHILLTLQHFLKHGTRQFEISAFGALSEDASFLEILTHEVTP